MKIKIPAILLIGLISKNTAPILAQSTDNNRRVELTILENSEQYRSIKPNDYFNKIPNASSDKEYKQDLIMPALKDAIDYDISESTTGNL